MKKIIKRLALVAIGVAVGRVSKSVAKRKIYKVVGVERYLIVFEKRKEPYYVSLNGKYPYKLPLTDVTDLYDADWFKQNLRTVDMDEV